MWSLVVRILTSFTDIFHLPKRLEKNMLKEYAYFEIVFNNILHKMIILFPKQHKYLNYHLLINRVSRQL